jgi:hypothetical protein
LLPPIFIAEVGVFLQVGGHLGLDGLGEQLRRPLAKDIGENIAWFEAVAGHWNSAPTPFVWAGKRKRRRDRQRERQHRVGGSAAYTRRALRRSKKVYGYEQGK